MTAADTNENPFATLGIAATLDLGRIKLAYFAALAKHPPHTDPQGFRAIRNAYESLQGARLTAAYLRAPLDLDAESTALAASLGPLRERVVAEARSAGQLNRQIATFEALLALDLATALSRAGTAVS